MKKTEVIIIGAGAAGLMCAIEAGKRGRNVLVLESANKPGKKILMSGGGRCNFTNYHVTPDNFISHNSHFCKSALSRYTQWDFIELVKQHNIPFHEKTRGQLFCDNKSTDILNMLLAEAEKAGVHIHLNTSVDSVEHKSNNHYYLTSSIGKLQCESLVIASGGLSIPTMGASPFAYKVAEQFGIKVWPTRAGLVPFTLQANDKARLSELSGVSVNAVVSCESTQFDEDILFTHRGLSGPAILQISSYWQPGKEVIINLLPNLNVIERLTNEKKQVPKQKLKTVLQEHLPNRVVTTFFASDLLDTTMHSLSHKHIDNIAKQLHTWAIVPGGTEGYRTAEVTLGGVDCNAIDSKTMQATNFPGLYFIGEALDVNC